MLEGALAHGAGRQTRPSRMIDDQRRAFRTIGQQQAQQRLLVDLHVLDGLIEAGPGSPALV